MGSAWQQPGERNGHLMPLRFGNIHRQEIGSAREASHPRLRDTL